MFPVGVYLPPVFALALTLMVLSMATRGGHTETLSYNITSVYSRDLSFLNPRPIANGIRNDVGLFR